MQVGGILVQKADNAAFLLFTGTLSEVMTGHCNCAAMLIDDSSSNTVVQMSTFDAQCFNTNECAKLIPLKVYCCVWWNGLSGFADALAVAA